MGIAAPNLTRGAAAGQNSASLALTLQFLTFVAGRPRTYAETMEAWRTSCPRLSIWEDALGEDLVRIERAAGQSTKVATVVLTPAGAALLAEHNGESGFLSDVGRLDCAATLRAR